MGTMDVNDRLGKGGYNGVAVWRSTNGAVEGLVLPNGNVVKVPILISQSYSPITRSSDNSTDTAFQTLYSVTLPGNTMNYNGKLVIEQDWKGTSSSNAKTLRVDWGGNWITGPTMSTNVNAAFMLAIKNANSLSSQIMLNGTSYSTSDLDTTTSVDTTQDVVIDFKCSWTSNVVGAVGTEKIILRGYSIWYYPGNT
jgi:hypothetical protein